MVPYFSFLINQPYKSAQATYRPAEHTYSMFDKFDIFLRQITVCSWIKINLDLVASKHTDGSLAGDGKTRLTLAVTWATAGVV